MNKEGKNKIVNINHIDIITNGSLEELETVSEPNQVGNVVNDVGEVISEITPLFMIINQNHNLKAKLEILVKNGGDLDKEIDYYGKKRSARYILDTFRSDVP